MVNSAQSSNVINHSFAPIHETLPPQVIECEEMALGSCIYPLEAIDVVQGIITESTAFYLSAHQIIYRAMLELRQQDIQINMLSLVDMLKVKEQLEVIGGRSKIIQLMDRTVSAISADAMANLVMDKYQRRQLIKTGNDIVALGFQQDKPLTDVLGEAEQKIFALAQDQYKQGAVLRSNSAVSLEAYEALSDSMSPVYPTELYDLDKLIGGFEPGTLTVLAGRPSMGKALPLDAKIVTPTGWKLMRDIHVGDLVTSEDGNFYPVTGVYPQGIKQTYRIDFNDGTATRCCADHLWFTTTRTDRKAGRLGSVKPLREIMQTLWVGGEELRLNHQIPITAPVNFPEKALPIDPYLLGIWLGDGGKNSTSVQISNPELDIVAQIKNLVPIGDYVRHDTERDRVFVNGANMLHKLEALGLHVTNSYDRYIPELYKTASVEQRFSLLAGLLDTDGHVAVTAVLNHSGNCIEYSTTSEQLKNDVLELVRSLGGRATFIQRMGVYKHKGERVETRTNYRIYISFPKGTCPVRSEKHLSRFTPRTKAFVKVIQSVIPDAEAECQCITVASPSRLFLTDDYIATHNSQCALFLAHQMLALYNLPVIFFSLEMSRKQIEYRLWSLISAHPAYAKLNLQPLDTARIRRHRTGQQPISSDDWEMFAQIAGAAADLPLFINDSRSPTLFDIQSQVRQVVAARGTVGLVVVDYLQMMSGVTEDDNRAYELGKLVRGLYTMAGELDVPVLALSQVNRAVEGRNNKRPGMADLAQSGIIEMVADSIISIYRDEYYDPASTESGIIELTSLKNRHGSTGITKVLFDKYSGMLKNLARKD